MFPLLPQYLRLAFGYDISCIYSLCADQEDFASLFSVLTGLGIDGWSMGVSAKIIAAES
jgi:hypothetical protein